MRRPLTSERLFEREQDREWRDHIKAVATTLKNWKRGKQA